MKPLGKPKLTKTKVAGHQNCAVCHPDTKGGRTREKRMSKQEIESQEHKPDCPWHQDWSACSCGVFDIPNPPQEHLCSQVIPGTFLICGEDHYQYCSTECYNKAMIAEGKFLSVCHRYALCCDPHDQPDYLQQQICNRCPVCPRKQK